MSTFSGHSTNKSCKIPKISELLKNFGESIYRAKPVYSFKRKRQPLELLFSNKKYSPLRIPDATYRYGSILSHAWGYPLYSIITCYLLRVLVTCYAYLLLVTNSFSASHRLVNVIYVTCHILAIDMRMVSAVS